MPPDVRIQHYVPQFYLRQFAQKRKRGYYIRCFDKTELKSFTSNTKGIACEAYFYDSPESNQPTEKWLTRLERRFAKSYSRLVQHHEQKRLSTSDRVAISNFVSSQWVRTREHREVIRDLVTQTKSSLEEKNITNEILPGIEMTSVEDLIVSLQVDDMKHIVSKMARIIRNMKWILFVNDSEVPFWTSDHPISRYNPVESPNSLKGNLGLLSEGIQKFFPLTPRLSLTICDPLHYHHLPNVTDVEAENVVFQNDLQVIGSTRYIFSKTDDFSLAKRRIEDNPEFGRLDRRRIKSR